MQEIKQKIKETDGLSRQVSNEIYNSKSLAAKAVSSAYGLIQEGKSLRAKLKYERENKRQTQEAIWAKAYDTCLLEKDNRRNEKLRRAKEATKEGKWHIVHCNIVYTKKQKSTLKAERKRADPDGDLKYLDC